MKKSILEIGENFTRQTEGKVKKMEIKNMLKTELYEINGAIIELDFEYPNIAVYKDINEYRNPAGDCTLFFDEEQINELKTTIQILEKGIEILQKNTKVK